MAGRKGKGSSTRYNSTSGSRGSANNNGPLFSPIDHGTYANGDITCKALGKRIDQTICVVQSHRHPDKCSGCKFEATP